MFLPSVRFLTFDSRYCHQARNRSADRLRDPQPVKASGHASKPDLDRWRTSGRTTGSPGREDVGRATGLGGQAPARATWTARANAHGSDGGEPDVLPSV